MESYYFEKTDKDEKYFVLIYDISNNKRRYKLAKIMQGYGKRVQESAFECCLPMRKLVKLKTLIARTITSEDSVRIYPISSTSDVILWNGELQFQKVDIIIC